MRILILAALVLGGGFTAGCFQEAEIECGDSYYAYRCFYQYSATYGYYRKCQRIVLTYQCSEDAGSDEAAVVAGCDGNVDCGDGEACLMDERVCVEVPAGCDEGEDCPMDGGSADGLTDQSGAGSQADASVTEADPDAGASNEETNDSADDSTDSPDSSPAEDRPTLDIACTSNSQCGAGLCREGECFHACESDSDCGSGDRCAAETGTRLCLPDPNPPVMCLLSDECNAGEACFDGSCRDECEVDDDCSNPQDRCLHSICQPDRRPIVECSLNLECGDSEVCLDGRCVAWCSDGPC